MRLALWTLVLVGCSSGEEGLVRMQFDDGLWDAPLPSQHLLSEDGTVRLEGIDYPDDVGFVSDLVSLIDGQLTGFGTTSAVFLPVRDDVDASDLPDLAGSLSEDASVQLLVADPDSPDLGQRVPLDVAFVEDASPFGPNGPHLVLLPLQGVPLRAETLYAAVVTTAVGTDLERSATVRDLARGRPVEGVSDAAAADYERALSTLDSALLDTLTGATVFRTQDPTTELMAVREAIAAPTVGQAPTLTDVFDDYCVYRGTLEVEVFQDGELPYSSEGGQWSFENGAPVRQDTAEAYVDVTIPRSAAPAGGWPIGVLVRTGAGGARALVDRGVRDEDGQVAIAGTGPALSFAQAGFAGLSMDGPHTGLRNTGGDEQFLMFNVGNPPAMRDNVRQTAVELAALPELLGTWTFDTSDCPDASATASFDLDHLFLAGHSMGATVAPLVLAAAPEYGAVVLSGAGGSWVENIMFKEKPLRTRPIAETMLGYDEGQLTRFDPALMLLQWAGESADPPAVAHPIGEDVHVLMVQGIVDHYILPPIANSASLSLGLELVGPSEDAVHAELVDHRPLEDLLVYSGASASTLPYTGQASTRAVFQQLEDGVEDGHEVWFQTDAAKQMTRCFLTSWVAEGTPTVVAPGSAQSCD
ncbi:MAG: hypothetical protein KC912_08945 [Proteobacteria bacterium]|nr:hypothetical protein [Pseudomonadota bacterium]